MPDPRIPLRLPDPHPLEGIWPDENRRPEDIIRSSIPSMEKWLPPEPEDAWNPFQRNIFHTQPNPNQPADLRAAGGLPGGIQSSEPAPWRGPESYMHDEEAKQYRAWQESQLYRDRRKFFHPTLPPSAPAPAARGFGPPPPPPPRQG
ncbi:hypothetical protein CMI37_01635 [Candidatus Pacearchaeota archaeon]|jgi:hypothetical protein|nr:hypothetical protein [Candidatus Pacearchaeota archaeon]